MTDKILYARHRRLSLNPNVEVSNKDFIPMREAVGRTRDISHVSWQYVIFFVKINRLALASPNQVLGVIATPCVWGGKSGLGGIVLTLNETNYNRFKQGFGSISPASSTP